VEAIVTRKFEHPDRRRRRQQLTQQKKQLSRSSALPVPNHNRLPLSKTGQFNLEPEQKLSQARSTDERKRRSKTGATLTNLPAASAASKRQIASKSPEKASRPVGSGLLLSMIRLVILGVGVGAIAGAVFTVHNLTSRSTAADSRPGKLPATPKPSPANPFDATLKPNLEMVLLKQQIQSLAAAQPGLTPGLFFLNLDTGSYLDLAGTSTFAAASMIKVPVLVAFFQAVDEGKIRLDEQLVMRPDLIAEGSGDMQGQPPGSKYSALETATQMIVISDNTATNMLMDRLGGATALNPRFQSWGLTKTVIRNPLADLEGTNTTSPQDLTKLLTLVSKGKLLSLESRDRLLDIMRQTVTDTLLPQGLGKGATIAHKTGDISSMVGDTGLIDMPNGQRYIATVMVKRPRNDPRAQELIRQISRLVYNHLNQPLLNPQISVTSPTPGVASPAAPPLVINSTPEAAPAAPPPLD